MLWYTEQPQAPPDTGLVTLAEVHGAFCTRAWLTARALTHRYSDAQRRQ